MPFTERGIPNAGKFKVKTQGVTAVTKTIREVDKFESLCRLHEQTTKKQEEAVKQSKILQEQEDALQTANAILYCQ